MNKLKYTLNYCVTKCQKPKFRYLNNYLMVYFETKTKYILFDFRIVWKDTLDDLDISYQIIDKFDISDLKSVGFSECEIINHYIELLNNI